MKPSKKQRRWLKVRTKARAEVTKDQSLTKAALGVYAVGLAREKLIEMREVLGIKKPKDS